MSDVVNHPKHYNHGKFECAEVIEDWKLGYHLGNCVKYICRCEHKGKKLEDLKKAKWYLDRQIQLLENEGCAKAWEERTTTIGGFPAQLLNKLESPPVNDKTYGDTLTEINKRLHKKINETT